MKLYPAIDLRDGVCVRLYQGDFAQATTYATDPTAQALAFEAMGFSALHVVDLNGAIKGRPVNFQVVSAIIEQVKIPVQLGGGIRTGESAHLWLEAGVSRIILGTVALHDPNLVQALAKEYPGRIMVGIDARDGMVAAEGWLRTSTIAAIDFAHRFEDMGVAAIVYTDIGRDGTLTGPNLEETAALADSVTIPVILSGGISSNEDLEAAAKMGVFDGVIIGKALYEKRIDVARALAAAA
ncbi:MAG: 1-(5-phosphoribosyl)-5-[(5-phosphoribosylamino)methylideneamino]imidazole-4-carboxamide isomerase [Alphaproteobacteria bacterium]